jgi:acetyl esterase/lipase
VFYHLPYTNPADPAHRLDVYAPEGGKNHPVIIWVHGGSWVRGDKSLAHRKPCAFTRKGFVFVSINYRFVPQVTVPDQAGDVAKAIKHVRDNCEKWGGDPRRIFVMGHSAGAHLSALVCTDEKYLKTEGLELGSIRGCIAVDVAAYDIPARYNQSGDSLRKTLANIFGADQESQKQVSPLHHVARNKSIPPFLVIHIDVNPQKSQSEAFVKKLTTEGVSTRMHAAKGRKHKILDEELGMAGDAPTKAVFEFLDTFLKDEKSTPPK